MGERSVLRFMRLGSSSRRGGSAVMRSRRGGRRSGGMGLRRPCSVVTFNCPSRSRGLFEAGGSMSQGHVDRIYEGLSGGLRGVMRTLE